MGSRKPNEKPPAFAFSVEDTAAAIGVSPQLVRLEIRRKNMKPSRVGRRIVIRREEIERYLDANS